MIMKQVTMESVQQRIADLERVSKDLGGLSLISEFELSCLRELVAVTDQRDAVVAENAGLKNAFGPGDAVLNFLTIALRHTTYDQIDLDDVTLAFKMSLPETPATDAAIAALRAEGEAPLIKALLTIANSEEIDGETVVCDFDTLVSVAAGALSQYYARQLRESKGEVQS